MKKASASSNSSDVKKPATDFDYTDTSTYSTTGKVACLLCQRQFKSEEILRKHVVQSDLHKVHFLFFCLHISGRWNTKLIKLEPWVQDIVDDLLTSYFLLLLFMHYPCSTNNIPRHNYRTTISPVFFILGTLSCGYAVISF